MFRCPKHNPALSLSGITNVQGEINPCIFCTDNYCGQNLHRFAPAQIAKELNDYQKTIEEVGNLKDNKIIHEIMDKMLEYVQSEEFIENLTYLCVLDMVTKKSINQDPIPMPDCQPFNETEMKQEQVVHVCMGDDRHYYFGSVAAIFDTFTPDELGVSMTTLWNYGLAPDRPYKNNKCSIYRNSVHRKKQTK